MIISASRLIDGLQTQRKNIIIAAIILQFSILGGMVARHSYPLLTGETIGLKVEPVDPRDLMRGDYVILSYPISQLSPAELQKLFPESEKRGRIADRTIYVSLEPDRDGRSFHASGYSLNKPASGRFIQGRIVQERWRGEGSRIRFGIEAFYVQEGRGKALEHERNNHQLTAEIALTSSGQAALRGLRENP